MFKTYYCVYRLIASNALCHCLLKSVRKDISFALVVHEVLTPNLQSQGLGILKISDCRKHALL